MSELLTRYLMLKDQLENRLALAEKIIEKIRWHGTGEDAICLACYGSGVHYQDCLLVNWDETK